MNIEILNQEIRTNEKYTFEFSDVVQRYIVGFSHCEINYPNSDHHVQEISVDLHDSLNEGNKVTVFPVLKMHDRHNHHEWQNSSIIVVVIAKVGIGNDNFHMITGIEEKSECQLPCTNITFLCSSLLSFNAYYIAHGHHLHKISSYVRPSSIDQRFILYGKTKMYDCSKHESNGITFGSVIAYSGNEPNIYYAQFDYKKDGPIIDINLGKAPKDFNPENCFVGCFINNFTLWFGSHIDHHVSFLKFGCNCSTHSIHLYKGNIKIRANLDCLLSDRHGNGLNINDHELSEFIILINKNKI